MMSDPPKVVAPRHCAANGCSIVVDHQYLFCRPHYWKLEGSLQKQLHESCRPGSGREHRPCPEWLAAAAEAVEFLASLEGLPTANRFREALNRLAIVPA